MTDLVSNVLGSPHKAFAEFPGTGTIRDVLNFGFSYVESEDNMVTYVLSSPAIILTILREMPESSLDPEGEILGKLFTADLMCSKRVKDNRIIFSNEDQTVVLILSIRIE